MITKTIYNVLHKLPIKINHNGFVYFSDGFIAFRHAENEKVFGRLQKDEMKGKVFVSYFDDYRNTYQYTIADKQPTIDYIKGKKRFHFGDGKQLLNATFVRKAFAVLGKSARFYISAVYRCRKQVFSVKTTYFFFEFFCRLKTNLQTEFAFDFVNNVGTDFITAKVNRNAGNNTV